jgi:hypothetical protein
MTLQQAFDGGRGGKIDNGKRWVYNGKGYVVTRSGKVGKAFEPTTADLFAALPRNLRPRAIVTKDWSANRRQMFEMMAGSDIPSSHYRVTD